MTERIKVIHGDSLEILPTLPENSIDSCVCDPPYHLTSIVKRFGGKNAAPAQFGTDGAYSRASRGFMGKQWDGGDVAFRPETWAAVYRVLKPGAYLLAFSGTRTYHRMACAIEDAGFEIRDQMAWVYGSGFPKSHDVSKAIDKAAGVEFAAAPASGVGFMGPDGPGGYNVTKNQLVRTGESSDAARQWQGWGTALKPALEPVCVARKPLIGTVAENVLTHGTGALNIDGCRVGAPNENITNHGRKEAYTGQSFGRQSANEPHQKPGQSLGRWPANLIHDGSDEVLAAFPGIGADSAARFFYTAKADSGDRLNSKHPTVKPVDLMAYLCRLVTQPGGTVLDPFAGSGTTGMACIRDGFNAVLIEREAEYIADIKNRLAHVSGGDTPLFGGDAPPRKPGRKIYGVFADEKSDRQD